jgi:murein DD-endopeptidase MepM/ murein hydrolase activator NlpD
MKQKIILNILGIWIFISSVSCATRSNPPAPVINASKVPASNVQSIATVSVASEANTQSKPKIEAVNIDDTVQTTPMEQSKSNRVIVAKSPANSVDSKSGWQMPTSGILGDYSVSSKGINISGTEGQAIYAVASGKVLYSGNGLKGYGNLIIIRHDNTYLSAYAYNQVNLVKEGSMVQQGQKIALMGINEDSKKAMLHFEVRKNGKPVDPHLMIGN